MSETYLAPLLISLKTVFVATVITFFLGLAVARWIAGYRGRFKSILDSIFLLPMVLPPTVVGFILLLLFGKNGPLGQFLLLFNTTIVFSWTATVIAAVVMAFPLMYMAARGAFEMVDINVENAARTLGASEWRIFWSITMPLAWPGIASGAVLALARCLGEFGATLMLAGNIPGKTATIPVAIYFAIQAGDTKEAIILGAIVFIIAFASLAAIAIWKGRTSIIRNVLPVKEE